MTAFSAIRKAVLRAEGTVVQEVFSSSDQVAVEMADLANEVAADIAKSHDWRGLLKIHTIVGDGSASYDLPVDFDRLTMQGDIVGENWTDGFYQFADATEWQMAVNGAVIADHGWFITGRTINFWPTHSSRVTLTYISSQWARAEDGTPKGQFTADDDLFALDERVLSLGLIWRWKAQKGLDYGEDLASFDLALAQAQGRDGGPKVIRPATRSPRGALPFTGRAYR